MAEEEPQKTKLDWLTIALLVTIALLFDLLSVVPFLNIITNFIAWFTLGALFWFLGIGFNFRKLIAPVISFVIEFIPLVSLIPSITLAVIITTLVVKSEERLGLKIPKVNPVKK
jgi:hypothetical protein